MMEHLDTWIRQERLSKMKKRVMRDADRISISLRPRRSRSWLAKKVPITWMPPMMLLQSLASYSGLTWLKISTMLDWITMIPDTCWTAMWTRERTRGLQYWPEEIVAIKPGLVAARTECWWFSLL